MSNNSVTTVAGLITYAWNPFQDILANNITDEQVTTDVNSGGIIVPRCGPFFSRNFRIKLKDSGKYLSFEAGDYSFIHPFGAFIKKYNRLAWGALQVRNITATTNFVIEYSTIGGDFVLNDLAYAEAVANTITAARTVDWANITDLPTAWPSDPHQHPASDTMNYTDMMVWMQSYLNVILEQPSVTILEKMEKHMKEDLNPAHGATLEMLGVTHLKDWAMATTSDIPGNTTEKLMNMGITKELIRAYARGDWQ